ncbi:MAG: hypothetical protein ACJAWV_001932 [Flammeovirgaceae bacterium]|jgi:hypothetical protein
MEIEGFIKLAAMVIGLIAYQFIAKKNKQAKKPRQGPSQPNSPIAPRKAKSKPVVEEVVEDKGIKYEPVTFEELLQQFGEGKKKTSNPRMEREEKAGMDNEFIPATDTPEEFKSELDQYYEELGDDKFKITLDDLKDGREGGNFAIKKKRMSKYAKMFTDKETVKDMFIMKEIFDRKF